MNSVCTIQVLLSPRGSIFVNYQLVRLRLSLYYTLVYPDKTLQYYFQIILRCLIFTTFGLSLSLTTSVQSFTVWTKRCCELFMHFSVGYESYPLDHFFFLAVRRFQWFWAEGPLNVVSFGAELELSSRFCARSNRRCLCRV